MEDEVLVTEPNGAAQHAHPSFDVAGVIVDVVGILDQLQQISLGQLFEDEIEILVLCGKDRV